MAADESTELGVLRVGDAAPSFTLPTVDGGTTALEDVLRDDHSALLVFLRHPG